MCELKTFFNYFCYIEKVSNLYCLGRVQYETNRKSIYFSFISVTVFVIDENLFLCAEVA